MVNASSKAKSRRIALIVGLLLVFLLTLTIVLVIWSRSNLQKISASEYENLIRKLAIYNWNKAHAGPKTPVPTFRKNGVIKTITIDIYSGINTVYIKGLMKTARGKLAYASEWTHGNFDNFVNQRVIEQEQAGGNFAKPTETEKDRYKLDNYFAMAAEPLDGGDPLVKGDILTKDRNFVPFWQQTIATLLPWILIIGSSAFFFIMLIRLQTKGGGMGIFGFGRSRAVLKITDKKFSDVAGLEDEKQELMEIVDYLKNTKKYATAGVRIPRGILLEGPPGTGKTLLAKAVSGEAGVPFFSVSGSEFEEVFVGVGASRVRGMFQQAKKKAPSIIFIDEIDALGRRRNSGLGQGAGEQTLNQILVELDGFDDNIGVIVMAATNMVTLLDPALLRPGRFDRKIQIGLPDLKARVAILKLHARNKKVSKQISFKQIALRTPGFSGAQLENVFNEAAILMVRHKASMITSTLMDEAIDRVIGGPAKRTKTYNLKDKKIVSYHESGHALLGLKLKHASRVQKVTIIPRGAAGGYTIIAPKEEIKFLSKQHIMDSITGLLGGRAAEEIMFGTQGVTIGAHDDLEKATEMARKIVTEFGMSKLGLTQFESKVSRQEKFFSKSYSEGVALDIDKEVDKILKTSYEIAKTVISENRAELKLIAKALFTVETITAEDLEFIDKNLKLPPEIIAEVQKQEEFDRKKAAGSIIEVEPKT